MLYASYLLYAKQEEGDRRRQGARGSSAQSLYSTCKVRYLMYARSTIVDSNGTGRFTGLVSGDPGRYSGANALYVLASTAISPRLPTPNLRVCTRWYEARTHINYFVSSKVNNTHGSDHYEIKVSLCVDILNRMRFRQF